MLQLSEEDVSQTLRRASEIVEQQSALTVNPETTSSFEIHLRSAEEAGIPRAAMLQALSERYILSAPSLKEGEIVFAPSADKAWYAAAVKNVVNESSVTIEFLSGGEQTTAVTDIRPATLIPGRQVQFDYSVVAPGMHGIWHTGKILQYDSNARTATVQYGYTPYSVPLSKLRLQPETQQVPLRIRSLVFRVALIAGGFGTAIGFLIGHFLH